MVALDLDGTLLGPDHTVSDATKHYLRSLHEKGFIVSIATGRSPGSTFDVIESLGFNSGFFPLVCLNGARGMEIKSSGVNNSVQKLLPVAGGSIGNPAVEDNLRYVEIFHEPVPRDVTLKSLRLAKELGLATNYYIGHEIHAQRNEESHHELTQRYTELTGTQVIHCNDDYEAVLAKSLPSKMVVLCETSKLDSVCSRLNTELEGEAHVIRGSPPWFVEILNKDVNKGRGLELMCKRLGVRLEETIAFGDGDNDREFLHMAGRGLAMQNARDAVKARADGVTKWTNAEDGVMRTLQCMEKDGLLCFPNEEVQCS